MSDSELPGQLPPRRSRAIRRPPPGATGDAPVEPGALVPRDPTVANPARPAPSPRLEAPADAPALAPPSEPAAPPTPKPPSRFSASEPAAAPRATANLRAEDPAAAEPPPPARFTGRTEPRASTPDMKMGHSASASRAAFPSRNPAPEPPRPARSSDPADAARRRGSAAETAEAPLLQMPPPPPSRSAGPLAAVVLGMGLMGGALALAWPSGSPRQLTTVVTPAPTPLPVVAAAKPTPEPQVYNPYANGRRPPVRRTPRPVVVVATPEPEPEPTPISLPKPVVRPKLPVQPGDTAAYPQATPKPTPEPLANGGGFQDPFLDPYSPAPTVGVPSKSLDMKVTNGVVIGSGEPLKAYSLSLLVHNRSKERIERLRVVLKRGGQTFETTNFSALESGERQELQVAFSGVPKNFHPQRLEVQWSTITGDFVTEKAVSDVSWTKATGGY